VLVVTWCCREGVLGPEELALLDRICEAYYLPAWVSVADYKRLFGEGGLPGERLGGRV
jgi:tocopherol O-methyltransferase